MLRKLRLNPTPRKKYVRTTARRLTFPNKFRSIGWEAPNLLPFYSSLPAGVASVEEAEQMRNIERDIQRYRAAALSKKELQLKSFYNASQKKKKETERLKMLQYLSEHEYLDGDPNNPIDPGLKHEVFGWALVNNKEVKPSWRDEYTAWRHSLTGEAKRNIYIHFNKQIPPDLDPDVIDSPVKAWKKYKGEYLNKLHAYYDAGVWDDGTHNYSDDRAYYTREGRTEDGKDVFLEHTISLASDPSFRNFVIAKQREYMRTGPDKYAPPSASYLDRVTTLDEVFNPGEYLLARTPEMMYRMLNGEYQRNTGAADAGNVDDNDGDGDDDDDDTGWLIPTLPIPRLHVRPVHDEDAAAATATASAEPQPRGHGCFGKPAVLKIKPQRVKRLFEMMHPWANEGSIKLPLDLVGEQNKRITDRQADFKKDYTFLHGVAPTRDDIKSAFPDNVEPFGISL